MLLLSIRAEMAQMRRGSQISIHSTSVEWDPVPKPVTNPRDGDSKIDIIAVPAIAASPETTWRFPDDRDKQSWRSLYHSVAGARVYLYSHPAHDLRRQYGVEYYAQCLLQYLVNLPDLGQRPLHFAAHSTGGIVLKKALIDAMGGATSDEALDRVVRCCFSVAFWGVPHYGSTVLSDPVHKENVMRILGLPRPMTELLRLEFSSLNLDQLERFSEEFAALAIGLKKIWTFVEARETSLTVVGGGQKTSLEMAVVDRRSATLSTSNLEFGSEEVIEVSSNHAELPRFGNRPNALTFLRYLDDLKSLIDGLFGQEQQDLASIEQQVRADVHLFYDSSTKDGKSNIKVWSETPKLQELLENGPAACLRRRLPSVPDHRKPKDELRKNEKLTEESSVPVPTIVISFEDEDQPNEAESRSQTKSVKSAEPVGESNDRDTASTQDNDMPLHELSATDESSKNFHSPVDVHPDQRGTKQVQQFQGKAEAQSAHLPMTSEQDVYDDFHLRYGQDLTSMADFFAPEILRSTTINAPNSKSNTTVQRDGQLPETLGVNDTEKERFPRGEQGTFKLPDLSRSLFRWIHLPANNMLWVPSLFQVIAKEERQPSLYKALLHKQVWNSKQNVARHGAPHGRFMQPGCQAFFQEAMESSRLDAIANITSPINDVQISVYFPYLHWDTFGSLIARSRLIAKRLNQKSSYPVDPSIKNDSLEHKFLWFYLNNSADLPLHHRRSLDQYGYPHLVNTRARDEDQVLYKRSKFTSATWTNDITTAKAWKKSHLVELMERERLRVHGSKSKQKRPVGAFADLWSNDNDSKVLMVDQLWCWVVDHGMQTTYHTTSWAFRTDSTSEFNANITNAFETLDTVITCFPPQSFESRDGRSTQGDLRSTIYSDVNGDPRFATQCRDSLDLAALAIFHAVTVLLEKCKDKDLQVFDVFSEYISVLTEHQTKSFKVFRDSQLRQETGEDQESIRETLRSLHNRVDLSALLELRDIEDELKTLDKLFSEQLTVIDQMLLAYERIDQHKQHILFSQIGPEAYEEQKDSVLHLNSISWLRNARMRVTKYQSQAENMRSSCISVQESYKLLLDMKQKQANVAEASLSRLSAEVASEQNRAIMIFTIFTIIFLPLSFFTSFFGMNVSDWSGQKTNLSLHTTMLITGLISAAVIVVALLLAFSRSLRNKVRMVLRQGLKRWPAKILKFFCRPIAQYVPRISDSTSITTHRDLEHGIGPRSSRPSEDWKVPMAGVDVHQIGSNGMPKSNLD